MMTASSHSKPRPSETLATVTARASRSPVPAKRPNLIRSSLAFMDASPMAAELRLRDAAVHCLP
jgi:hypothetical protein